MSEFFLQIINMSISASWIILAVLILRLLLKKAPKWITVLLWGVVAVRLICPFTVESVLSLIPSTQTVSPDIMLDRTPTVNTGVPVINNALNPVLVGSLAPDPMASANPLQILIPIYSCIWVFGIAVMLIYTAVSYLKLKKRIGTAILLRENIYQSENVASPFVLGIIKPKIYLPFNISEQDTEHVIAHEQAHLRRCDHLWKPLGFLILSLHWFNPLMWVGYVLLCRDIELACDEKVIKELTPEQRADYSQALLTCSVSRRMIAACPLAFGEIGVKNRVKTVLNYKKPAFWVIVVAVIALIAAAVCFLTDPVSDKTEYADPPDNELTVDTGADTQSNGITRAQIDRLKAKFPEYFSCSTAKGLEVYVWQMAENMFNCGVMPGVNRVYSEQELWELVQNPATLYEMRMIIAYYISNGAVTRDEVSVIGIQMPHSSYAYTVDERYKKQVRDLFWEDFPEINYDEGVSH